MTEHTVSPRVVEQRIRNRLMEWLEDVSGYESHPTSGGLDELLNQWKDWSAIAPTLASFPHPTYTKTEAELLIVVAVNWDALCSATPQTITAEFEVLRLPAWQALLNASRAALAAMRSRGRLSETFEDD